MAPQAPFALIYAPITRGHLRSIDRKYYSLIRSTLQERLAHEPTSENRNRKPLRRTAFEAATWELRFGPDNMFRVFYDVLVAEREVHILAIGVKLRGKLFVGGQEIDL
ncbi:MAG: addiction module toxin RelE [Chloroflexia bacterium]|nr:addiction module toxin RelE [Chloroflexia bacterium]